MNESFPPGSHDRHLTPPKGREEHLAGCPVDRLLLPTHPPKYPKCICAEITDELEQQSREEAADARWEEERDG